MFCRGGCKGDCGDVFMIYAMIDSVCPCDLIQYHLFDHYYLSNIAPTRFTFII